MTAVATLSPHTRPRAVVVCTTAWGVRNAVTSGMVGALAGDLDVRFVAGGSIANSLSERVDAPGVAPLLPIAHPRQDPWASLLHASFSRRHRLHSFTTHERRLISEPGLLRPVRRQLLRALSVVGARHRILEWQVARDLARARRRPGMEGIRAQLRELAPRLVVVTAPVVPEEAAYAVAAHQLGIRTLGCILSFDNLTSRGRQPTFTDYAVWSGRMRDELLRLYPDTDPEHVHVTGTPQFDLHRQPGLCRTRAQTLDHLGLPRSARYVLYAGNARRFTPTEPALVSELARRMHASPVVGGHYLVIRPHPADDLSRWSEVAAASPGLVLCPPRSDDGRFGTHAAQCSLISAVAHADVCINMASTMSLDAAVLDTPVACVGFALTPGSVEDRLAACAHATTHFGPVVASGGVRLADSLDGLVQEVAAYVTNPDRDRLERRHLVADMCGPTDGGAARRIADLIRSLCGLGLDSAPGARPMAIS